MPGLNLKTALSILLASTTLAARAHADEGIARITELGDRDLVAQSQKARTKPKEPHYRSVEPEDTASDYFKGSPPPQISNFFFGVGSNYFDGFGLQARYSMRVMDKVLPELNNALNIEGGLAMTFYGTRDGQSGVTGLGFVAMGRWDFQLDKNFIFFGDLGFGFNGISNNKKDFVHGGGMFPAVGVGAMYNFNNDWAMRADISYQFTGAGVVRRF